MDVIFLPLFLLGLAVMAAEMLVFSFGVFLVIGLTLSAYALYVLDQAGTLFGQPVTSGTFIVLTLAGLLVLGVTLYFAVKHYNRRARPLIEGERVTVIEWSEGGGKVALSGGEIWNATSSHGFSAGDQAVVTRIDNLSLTIAKE